MPVAGARGVVELAEALFGAIERGDIGAVQPMFSPGVAVRKSGDRRDSDRERSIRTIGWFIDNTAERRYQILDRQVFDGGFVQQHVLHAAGHLGATIAARVCIVIKVGSDGLIHRVDEYFDPAELAPLLKENQP